ncbi:dentin sialophosphoprotein isoform X8 [Anolis carolinensis]|uniref:dentin sialophosphoprotein isoform X8 n=1 Tax=Anolis carolinensis TaxID=28377 RepID=UPI002F2B65E5
MKTAVVCWSLFSITFAFPIAQPPPAGALKKLEIEKVGSHLVNSDAKAQGEFYSSDGNDDKAQKEDPHLVSSDAKAREGGLSDQVKGEEATKEESFSSDGSDDKAQKEFYSSDGNDDKAQKEDPHLLSSDAKAREGGLSDQVKGEEATKEEFYSSDGNDDKAQKEGSHFVNSDAKARAETFSSDGSDDKAQKDAVDVPVQHAEAQSSADHLEYRQLERRAFSTLNSHFVESRDSNNYEEDFISPTASDDNNQQEDLISPNASDDNNQQEISYALDDNDNAFKFVNERAFDDGYAGNDAEVGAEAEFVNDSLENVLASVDTENPDTPTPVA